MSVHISAAPMFCAGSGSVTINVNKPKKPHSIRPTSTVRLAAALNDCRNVHATVDRRRGKLRDPPTSHREIVRMRRLHSAALMSSVGANKSSRIAARIGRFASQQGNARTDDDREKWVVVHCAGERYKPVTRQRRNH